MGDSNGSLSPILPDLKIKLFLVLVIVFWYGFREPREEFLKTKRLFVKNEPNNNKRSQFLHSYHFFGRYKDIFKAYFSKKMPN